MARARNIKPGFFKNYDLADLGPYAQLLFAGLWCLADKEGRLKDQPRLIKAEIFPYYEVDVNGELTKLERLAFIDRYEVDGMAIIQIANFVEHQSPHHTEKASTLPSKSGDQAAKPVPEPLTDIHGDLTVNSQKHNGENPPDSLIHRFTDSLIPDSSAPQAAKPKQKRAPSKTSLPEGFCISDRVKAWAAEKGHQFLEIHFDHFISACKRRGYTYADWDEAFMSAVRDNWAKLDPAKIRQINGESSRPPKPDGDYVWVDAQKKWVHRNFLGVK